MTSPRRIERPGLDVDEIPWHFVPCDTGPGYYTPVCGGVVLVTYLNRVRWTWETRRGKRVSGQAPSFRDAKVSGVAACFDLQREPLDTPELVTFIRERAAMVLLDNRSLAEIYRASVEKVPFEIRQTLPLPTQVLY